MRTIWKYDLDLPEMAFTLGAPNVVYVGSQFPHAGFDDTPVVWIEHDPDATPRRITLRTYGTGHPIAKGDTHLGSVWLPSSGLVWHVYEAA